MDIIQCLRIVCGFSYIEVENMKINHILMAAGLIAAATFGVSNIAMAEDAAAPAAAEATAEAEAPAVDCATLEGEEKTACEAKAAEAAAEAAPAEGAAEAAPAEGAAH